MSIDIKGQRFGRLVAIKFIRKTATRKSCWLCRCDCGKESFVPVTDLTSGKTKSCGCLKKELVSKSFLKHGDTGSRLYRIWQGMKGRCYNENRETYKYYGGKGIVVCDEWLNDYDAFKTWALNCGYSDDLTIDRIDYDGNYEPENCRWITKAEQAANTSKNYRITINKSTRHLSEWCKIFCVRYDVVYGRLRGGWSEVEALTTPEGEKRK